MNDKGRYSLKFHYMMINNHDKIFHKLKFVQMKSDIIEST